MKAVTKHADQDALSQLTSIASAILIRSNRKQAKLLLQIDRLSEKIPSSGNGHAQRTRRHDNVLRLKALMGKAGCRKIAATFNRMHGTRATVGKTFVADTIRSHQYELACLVKDLRARPPLPTRVNATWAMDLTFHTDAAKTQQPVLGIIDHGSRLLTRLCVLKNKCAWTLLGHLCLAIGRHGKPRALRTDNEAVFNSFVFRTLLRLLGIRHQHTEPASPWQNGRIERLFGTLKPLLRQLLIPNASMLGDALAEFTLFYNHARPHQNLGGMTPAEVWNGIIREDLRSMKGRLVDALDGLLVGYHMRR